MYIIYICVCIIYDFISVSFKLKKMFFSHQRGQ